MTWAKLDDAFWSNPKVEEAGNEVAGAYARMLSYCGQHLTDGYVKEAAAKYIAKPSVLKRLEEMQFLHRNGNGWVIPDYLDFNPTKEKVEKERAAARRRMAKVRGTDD